MKYIFLTVVTAFSTSAFAAKTETKEFDSKYVKSLVVENMAGVINITGVENPKMIVIADQEKFPADCRLEISQEGTEVTVKVDQKSFLRKDCVVNFTINVPPAINMNIRQGSGNLTIINTKGAIDYKVGSGDVSIDSEIEKIDGKIGSGATTVKGLKGDAHFFAGSGAHKLTYMAAPKKGELEVKTGTGDADIYMPSDSKVSVDAKMGTGKTTNELGESTKGKFKIVFKAGSGNLNIHKKD